MSEKVLFEMRVTRDEDGTHVEINESPEWRSYHRARHPRLLAWVDHCADEDRDEAWTSESTLRRALDSLQGIYDDLYGAACAAEAR